jgi:hypothetical protein
MKKFVLKLFLLSLPFIIIIGFFLALDPFRIIYKYNGFSNMYVIPNKDFVSSEMFIKNQNKYNYNSFIFGSSRTIAFKTKSWKRFLSKTANPFVFDASGESIFGIYTKITYLDKLGVNINNCLLIICTDCTFAYDSDHKGHLFIKHPTIANTSWINFYTVFIKDYFDLKFLKNYFRYLITRKYIPTMNGYIEYRKIIYNNITNDTWMIDPENELKKDPINYYKKRKNIFYERDSIILSANSQISKKQISMLNKIREIFNKHHTNYKIIISPLYNQISINNNDLLTLRNIFGKNSVFNFSGKNKFTSVKENYYESSHYRPIVGDSILSRVYK